MVCLLALVMHFCHVRLRQIGILFIILVEAVCRALPLDYVSLLLKFLGEEVGRSRHFQFYTTWIEYTLKSHLMTLKTNAPKILPALNQIEKNLIKKQEDLISLLVFDNHCTSCMQIVSFNSTSVFFQIQSQ